MKLRNIFICLIAVVVSFLGISVDAASTAPNSYNTNFSNFHLLDGKKYLDGASLHFYYKVNTDGKVIYCYDQERDVPTGITTYKLNSEVSAKYAYILENGYPNKSLTGDNDKDYFITGMAIWYVVNPNNSIFRNFNISNGTFLGKSNDVAKWMGKLVNGANSYSYAKPSIKVNNPNSSMSLSSDGKYYVSNQISVSTTGSVGNYTVSLSKAPTGTIVTDVNGNKKNTFAINEKFIVKVPVSSIKSMSSEFSVNVKATGTIKKAYLYATSSSSIQRTIALYPVSNDVNANTTLNITKTSKVVISKKDATTGEELPGATLVLKDSNGNIKDTWVSTNESHVIEGLEPGKYTLSETIAPEGYKLSTETVEFTIKEDGTVDKPVVMYNAPLKTVLISKQDATTGKELPGAHLELKNEKGELIEAWVSGDEPHVIEGLKPGKYFLTEVLAPEGYETSTETVEFTVKEDGSVDGTVVMLNKPETIVEVPSTSSFKTITTSLIGLIIIGLGSMVIYRNYKKNEEV